MLLLLNEEYMNKVYKNVCRCNTNINPALKTIYFTDYLEMKK